MIHAQSKKNIFIRFYEELNDFLPESKRKKTYSIDFFAHPTVKTIIETEGIPHTEVDMILINGKPVGFNEKVENSDHISVYPVFESFDISHVSKVRNKPLRSSKFISDIHLGKLARLLRLAGFDVLYKNNWTHKEMISISNQEKRALLTRNIKLLMNKDMARGYFVRSEVPYQQLLEIMIRFDLLSSMEPFSRCMLCNAPMIFVHREEIKNLLPEKVKHKYHQFYQCSSCRHLYWQGYHYPNMIKMFNQLRLDIQIKG